MKINNLRSLIRESINEYIKDIDEAGTRAMYEAKMTACDDAINKRKQKIEMAESLEEMQGMFDETKMGELKKEIKMLEKQKAKYGKMLEKMNKGKEVVTEEPTEAITEEDPIDETDVMAGMNVDEEITEEAINESFLKMQKLAGVITEAQYNEKKSLIETQLNERVEIMNKLDQANPDYNYRNMLKIQPYPDGKEYYAQVIGLFTDDNKDKIEKYHVRIFSTNDANSSATLGEYTEEDLKKMKAVKIDDNDPEINDTIKKHKRYLKY